MIIEINIDRLFDNCVNQSLMECNDPDLAIDESHRHIFKTRSISLSLEVESAIRCRLQKASRGDSGCDNYFAPTSTSKLIYDVKDSDIDGTELTILINDALKSALMNWWYLSKNAPLAELYADIFKDLKSKLVFLTKGAYTTRPYRLI